MTGYYLVNHDDWDEPRKIYHGPNSNADQFDLGEIKTIGSSPDCQWTLPDSSLPGVVAFFQSIEGRRYYLYELNPEDYGSTNLEDFLKRKPVSYKVVTRFEVAGYKFLSRHDNLIDGKIETAMPANTNEKVKHRDRPRAAYIQCWDGHMSPGDFEGYERDLAAYTAWKNGEDVYEIIRKEREAKERARAKIYEFKPKAP